MSSARINTKSGKRLKPTSLILIVYNLFNGAVLVNGWDLSCQDKAVHSLSMGTYNPKKSNYLKD
jgi:hypothetical protein